MPRKIKLEALEAELSGLEALLRESQEFHDLVGKIQYEQRIQEVKEQIAEIESEERHLASIAMYFTGQPVFGSRGINADFAGKALKYFQEVVSKQFATSEIGSLGERGKVPFKDLTSLMVTGVAHGSFGFFLEELSDQTHLFNTDLKRLVEEVVRLIEATASPDDLIFEEAAEDLDPRTLMALQDFFVNLDSSAAAIRIVDDVRDLSLDESAVHRARIRTESTQISDDDIQIEGILEGFLPKHRRFELRTESDEVIHGSATKEAAEQFAATVHRGIHAIGKRCIGSFKKRTVKPLNRPERLVFRLLTFLSIGNDMPHSNDEPVSD